MIKSKSITRATFSVLYGISLALLPFDWFKDRGNYLIYAEDSIAYIYRYVESGWLDLFFNEPLFLIFNFLPSTLLEADQVVMFLIFIFSSIYAYAVLHIPRNKLFFIIFLLFFPQILKNYTMHLRQGYALAIFMYAFVAQLRTWQKAFLFSLTPLIHASYFPVIGLMSLVKLMKMCRMDFKLRLLLVLSAIFILFGPGFMLLEFTGSRHFQRYLISDMNITGLGFLFWAGVLALFGLQSKKWCQKNEHGLYFNIMYLSSYFIFPLSGRIFESVMPAVVFSGAKMQNRTGLLFFLMMFFYLFIQIIKIWDSVPFHVE